MELTTDTLGWLLLGCLIGYIVRYLQNLSEDMLQVKREVHEVDEIVAHKTTSKRVETPTTAEVESRTKFKNLALLIVVLLTVWAAFMSQRASNAVSDTQEKLQKIAFCNQQYLSKTIAALNERTTYSQSQNMANVALQKAQSDYLKVVLIQPPASPSDTRSALQLYFTALNNFIDVSGKSQQKVATNPYPTNAELSACLSIKE